MSVTMPRIMLLAGLLSLSSLWSTSSWALGLGEIHLNFSGHYRPPLTADYARYVFRTLANHPLLSIEKDCQILGRKFDEETYKSSVIRLSSLELATDDPELEEALEMVLI